MAKNKSGKALTLAGDLSGQNTQALKKDIVSLLGDGAKEITLDFSKVKSIDASGLALIVGAFKSVEREGGRFKIRNVSKKLQPLFEYARLERHFEISFKK